jgi:hypothetical protein
MDEITGGCRKLHNEKTLNLHSLPDVIRIIKSRVMRWPGHVERMGRRGIHAGFWREIHRERDH